MPANIGSQIVTLKFFDPVDSYVVNRVAKEARKLGIYSGGYLTKVTDVSVNLSPAICEIGDGTYQVRVETQAAVPITVSSALPYVVLRWTYTGSASLDYMDFQAVALVNILSTDVVVGRCVFAGATLTGFDYALRTNPNVMDLFLKAEVTNPNSMRLMVRAGRVNYGDVSFSVPVQESPLFVAPGSLSRIDLVQINGSGAVVVTQGTIAASPVAPSYGGLVTVAEVRLSVGQLAINSSSVTDVRSFVATGTSFGTGGLVPQGGIIMWSGSVASIQPGWQLCNGTNGTPDLRDRFVICADADTGGVRNVGSTGGSDTHTHSGSTNPQSGPLYRIDDNSGGTDYDWMNPTGHSHTLSVGAGSSMPKFYALAYIMKL